MPFERTPEERAWDLTLMSNDEDWPLWPVLPVKKMDRMPHRLGFLFALQGPRVYLANIFDERPLHDLPRKDYSNFQAIQDDGWEVD